MFWMFVAPFIITFLLLSAVVVVATVYTKGFGKRIAVFSVSILLSCTLFVPSCYVTMAVVDQLRFGTFQYEHYYDVRFFYGKRYLPDTAQNILLIADAYGFSARYEIDRQELEGWIESFLENNDEYMQFQNDPDDLQWGAAREFENAFEELGWETPPGLYRFETVIRGNGAGFTIWYSTPQKTAYQTGGYW